MEKAVHLSATRYCPAQAMLSQAAPIETVITIRESRCAGCQPAMRRGLEPALHFVDLSPQLVLAAARVAGQQANQFAKHQRKAGPERRDAGD